MRTITTTYRGATNTKGSRFIAKTEGGSITVGYDHALNADDNHRAAVVALCKKMRLQGKLVQGDMVQLYNSLKPRVWVFVEQHIFNQHDVLVHTIKAVTLEV
jgi:hypothetical protein